jgi:hypothetical protein
MNQSNQYYEFYFKLAYTCQTKIYEVNPDMSIMDFISDIKNRVRTDFYLESTEEVEIVEAGNPDNINGHDAELAPALEASINTIREIYGNRHTNVAFYIRKFRRVYTLNIPENVELNENEIAPPIRRTNSNQNNEENS